ncbi:MAG TPA: hypothetical protein VI821_00580 [Candidatus Paceibacterota bacterium]
MNVKKQLIEKIAREITEKLRDVSLPKSFGLAEELGTNNAEAVFKSARIIQDIDLSLQILFDQIRKNSAISSQLFSLYTQYFSIDLINEFIKLLRTFDETDDEIRRLYYATDAHELYASYLRDRGDFADIETVKTRLLCDLDSANSANLAEPKIVLLHAFNIASQIDTLENLSDKIGVKARTIDNLSKTANVIVLDRQSNPMEYRYDQIAKYVKDKSSGLTVDRVAAYKTHKRMTKVDNIPGTFTIKRYGKGRKIYLEKIGDRYRVLQPIDIKTDADTDAVSSTSKKIDGYTQMCEKILEQKRDMPIKIDVNEAINADFNAIRLSISRELRGQFVKNIAKTLDAKSKLDDITTINGIFDEAIYDKTMSLALKNATYAEFTKQYGESYEYVSAFAADFASFSETFWRNLSETIMQRTQFAKEDAKANTIKAWTDVFETVFENVILPTLKKAFGEKNNPFSTAEKFRKIQSKIQMFG